MNKSDYMLVTMTFLNFRKACRYHGGQRIGYVAYPDSGVCREGDRPKRCYRRRCPMLKGVTL